MSERDDPREDGMTYAGAGVDIRAKDAAAKSMVGLLSFARHGTLGKPIPMPGHFAGMVEFGDHALVLATDGVGTKLEIATAMKKWDTVGIDCVAMNVNDAICVGAEPIAFVDYLAVDKADPHLSSELAKGLNEGARQSNMTIVGGETAILPSIVRGYDLAGTVLAVVKKDKIVTGKRVEPGDAILGIPSSGIHSNGYTLVRRVFESAGIAYEDEVWKGAKLGHVLLEPTTIYVKAILDLLATPGVDVRAIANITGSGLLNVPRLKRDVRYVLDEPLTPHAIFDVVRELGKIDAAEMYRTFNMGMGMTVIVPADHADAAARHLAKYHPGTRIVGHVERGTGVSVPGEGVEIVGAKAAF